MTDEELTAAAERFCATPLPESVCADLVAIKPMKGRTGTNLLTVAEAKIMLAAALATPPAPNDDLRVALEAALCAPDWPTSLGHVHAAIAALEENRRG